MIENEYIKSNISKINKNNVMIIDFGTCISNNIFKNKHSSNTIGKLKTNISNNNIKIESTKKIKAYCYNNNILEIYPKKIHNYSYTNIGTTIFKTPSIDYKISILKINNNPNLTSNYNYNLIEERIETIIHFKNMFEIIITQFNKSNSYYSFKIKIKKPIDYSTLIENINYIISLFK